jgi:Tol biopolymer transport system component
MKRKSGVLVLVILLGFLAAIGLVCRGTFNYWRDAEYEPVWSPDGSKIAFIAGTRSGSHLYVMDADGSNVVQLVELVGSQNGGYFPGPTWSPDGIRIAYTTEINYQQQIWLINIDGSNAKRLVEDETQYQSQPIWSPDGKLIAYVCNHRDVEESNTDDICLVNVNDPEVKRLTDFSDYSSVYDFTWHADGEHIAFRKVAGDLSKSEYYLIDLEGSNLTLLPFLQMEDRKAVWSPDGTQIAFTKSAFDLKVMSDPEAEGLYVMNSDGSQVVKLMDSIVSDPAWSPDGRKLAVSAYDDTQEIFVMNADGSGMRQLTGKFTVCDLYRLTRRFC